ncbi:MAG TPA: hypothetical protein VK846_03325 [Candidatus Limnocylindria bacterium]|nr:hypothetical protein [Candidatus Limnocylindria bacterium]
MAWVIAWTIGRCYHWRTTLFYLRWGLTIRRFERELDARETDYARRLRHHTDGTVSVCE